MTETLEKIRMGLSKQVGVSVEKVFQQNKEDELPRFGNGATEETLAKIKQILKHNQDVGPVLIGTEDCKNHKSVFNMDSDDCDDAPLSHSASLFSLQEKLNLSEQNKNQETFLAQIQEEEEIDSYENANEILHHEMKNKCNEMWKLAVTKEDKKEMMAGLDEIKGKLLKKKSVPTNSNSKYVSSCVELEDGRKKVSVRARNFCEQSFLS